MTTIGIIGTVVIVLVVIVTALSAAGIRMPIAPWWDD